MMFTEHSLHVYYFSHHVIYPNSQVSNSIKTKKVIKLNKLTPSL